MRKVVKISFLGGALIIGLVFSYLLYKQKNFTAEKLPPPFIAIKEDFYATTTNELVVAFDVLNPGYLPNMNIGIRYDDISHATSTPSSETYEGVKLPPAEQADGGYEFRVPFDNSEVIYYRIQVAPFQGEFIWSDERSVSKD